jgi:hypothetical protein
VRLDVLLRSFDAFADHLRFNGHALLHSEPSHNRFDTVARKNAHQIVFERKEEARGARVALTARASAKLIINAPRFVAFGAKDI